jgi:alkylhydroperoxidase family enzyme
VLIGQKAGLSDLEIEAIKVGPTDPSWGPQDAWLLTAADELRADAFVTDRTWQALASHYSQQQLMDLVFTVGQYQLVSMALNTFGVQLDPDLPVMK